MARAQQQPTSPKKPKIFTYKRLNHREAQESKTAMYFYFTCVGMALCVVAVLVAAMLL